MGWPHRRLTLAVYIYIACDPQEKKIIWIWTNRDWIQYLFGLSGPINIYFIDRPNEHGIERKMNETQSITKTIYRDCVRACFSAPSIDEQFFLGSSFIRKFIAIRGNRSRIISNIHWTLWKVWLAEMGGKTRAERKEAEKTYTCVRNSWENLNLLFMSRDVERSEVYYIICFY